MVAKRAAYVIMLLLLSQSLSGCGVVLLGVASTTAAVAVMRDKSLGTSVDDASIWLKINSYLNTSSGYSEASVIVDRGRVLLAGIVSDARHKDVATEFVWAQDGVKEVINRMVIRGSSEDVKGSSKRSSAWITAEIRAKLLSTPDVKSVNYLIETVNGVVYLMGSARSKSELTTVIKIASSVDGVRKVVSYVEII